MGGYYALTPAHGHSKDYRPDLKQVKTGLIADGNGILLALITNVSADELDARNVLPRYKGPWKVKNLFKRLKKPMLVDTIFLKLPGRIEALMMMAYIALLLQAIMQVMARTRLSSMIKLPKIRYAKWSMDNPTYELLEWLFKPFVMISDGSSDKLTGSGDEVGQYIQFLLYLVDMDSC